MIEEDRTVTGSGKPLEQIRQKKYYEKYIGMFKKIFIIGAEFSKKDRNLAIIEWEEA